MRKPGEGHQAVKFFLQRGFRGYADIDWWNLNDYLSEWIPGALRKIRDGHGYPGRGEADTPEKWRKILNKMIKGFEAYKEKDNLRADKNYLKRWEKLDKEQKEGMREFILTPPKQEYWMNVYIHGSTYIYGFRYNNI